jgi:hypothetical protein
VAIVSLIFGAAILLFDIRSAVPDIISARLPEESKSSTVEFINVSGSSTKPIEDIGFSNVVLNLAYRYMLQKGLAFGNGANAIDIDEYEFADLSNELALSSLCESVEYRQNEHVKPARWPVLISEAKLNDAGIGIGSEIAVYDEETSVTGTLQITGVFSDSSDDGAHGYDMIIDNAAGEELLDKRGVSTEYTGSAEIGDIFAYPEYVAKLHKLGIRCYGIGYGEIVRTNAELKHLMATIAFIFAAIGFLIVIAYVIQSISKYAANIRLRFALGMQQKAVVMEFALLTELLLLPCIIFSRIVATILYGVIQRKIESVLDISISAHSVFFAGAAALLLVTNALLIFALLFIRKKIMRTNMAKLASE